MSGGQFRIVPVYTPPVGHNPDRKRIEFAVSPKELTVLVRVAAKRGVSIHRVAREWVRDAVLKAAPKRGGSVGP